VFTSAQAHACGWSRHQIQRSLSAREIVALRRGVYVEQGSYAAMASAERATVGAVAACLARPGSVVSHHSAALIHGLPLLGSRPALPRLLFPAEQGRHADKARGVQIRTSLLPGTHILQRGEWRVTTVARTVCDVAREERAINSLVLADAALARRQTTLRELCEVRDVCSGWPGSPALRETLRLAHSGSESPYESIARFQLLLLRMSVIPQVWAFDAAGWIGCGDIWLPSLWTFLEIDGDVKYDRRSSGDTTLLVEKLRQERLEEAGFGVARVSARQAFDQALVTMRVDRAAARGRLARSTAASASGFVGPPPVWADRGTRIPYQGPPSSDPSPDGSGLCDADTV
jgi:hypothetical protein